MTDGIVIKLGDRELETVSASVLRTMDTGADEFSGVIPEIDPNIDQELYDLAKPRSFADAEAYVDGKKMITGTKYLTSPAVAKQGSGVELRGYSKTYRLITSDPKEQREFLESSLKDIARAFVLPFGIFDKYQGAIDDQINEKFDNEKIGAQEKIFAFLQNLTRQRGLLLSSDSDGNLLFLLANVNQKPVGSIIEGQDGFVPITEKLSAVFDDTKIFQTYQAVVDTPYSYGEKDPQAIAKDKRIKIPGFKTITTNSTIKGAGQKAVDFTRNFDLADSINMPFTANSFYAPNGELWQENTTVSVVSSSLFVPNGFTFLIRAVEYNEDSGGGRTATLSLIPPSLYTGEAVNEPWG